MSKQCTLSDKELMEKSKEWVHKLAKDGGRSWVLRVPVDFNHDPDMLFIELCNRLEKQNQLVEELTKEGEAICEKIEHLCLQYRFNSNIKRLRLLRDKTNPATSR